MPRWTPPSSLPSRSRAWRWRYRGRGFRPSRARWCISKSSRPCSASAGAISPQKSACALPISRTISSLPASCSPTWPRGGRRPLPGGRCSGCRAPAQATRRPRETPDERVSMKTENIVVIGNGMVGQRFLEQLVGRTGPRAKVTVFCAEPRPAYDRVQLTSFLSGKSAADLSLVPDGFFEQHGIALRLGDKATAIDRARKVVRSARGHELPYDKLVLATGSYPFVPRVVGAEWPDCFVYRAIEDLEAIRAAAKRARVGAVVGGGLLGLEAAKALHDLGLDTHVVEFAPRLMAVQLDDSGARLLRRKIEALGVRVHTSKETTKITGGTEHAHRMVFADGTTLETDVIVYSAGIRPHDELARAAKLAVGERGGVVIDDHCRPSDP